MKRRILFIEDHEDTRELVRFVLEAGEYCVTAESTMAGALQFAAPDKFDLYLLDNWLPDGTGFELCERIREFDPNTPVLFYSGAAFDSDKLRAIQAGAQGYLAKPCPFADLLRAVGILITEAELRVAVPEVHNLVA
ncbi:MAG TPA: response regulator [Pyrinomonadaceae bacterium]|nr:response regulator [Pyrinomonadaceae bacterium]